VDKSQEMAHAFGAFVKAQRQLANISQRQLAKASGVSDSYLSQLERGHYSPSVEVLRGIARALDLPATALFAQFDAQEDAPDDAAVETTADDLQVAIRRDTSLSPAKKEALLVVYRALRDSPDDSADFRSA
jgi:transcriptional regulator with XRE-family HTH domain